VYSLLVRLNTGHTVLEQLQNALNIYLFMSDSRSLDS